MPTTLKIALLSLFVYSCEPASLTDREADSPSADDDWWSEVTTRLDNERRSFVEADGVFTASGRGVEVRLDIGGLHAQIGDDQLSVQLASWGRVGTEQTAENVHPTWGDCATNKQLMANGDCVRRVELPRVGMTESWQPVAGGFEQIWEIESKPPGSDLLVLNLVFDAATHWEVDAGHRGAQILGDTGGSWSYAGLEVWDATGDPIEAWMKATDQGLSLLVRDTNAVYPLTVDPTLSQDDKLMASDAAEDDYFGTTVSGAGDVNNDGFDDVIVGAPETDDNGNRSGSAYVYLGGPGGLDPSSELELFASDAHEDHYYGQAVSGAGDVNGDGYDDVMVGAAGRFGLSEPGRVYIYHGGVGGIDPATEVSFPASDGDNYDYFGLSVSSAGDLNDDGYDDIIVGDYVDKGAAYVYLGSAAGVDSATEVKLVSSDGGSNYHFGYSVACAGDIDDDGYDDVIVGAPDIYNGVYGGAYIYSGSAAGIDVASESKLSASDEGWGDQFGNSVAGAGDVDGDGYDDVIVGAPGDRVNNQNGAGSAYVYSGSVGGIDGASEAKLIATDLDNGDSFGLSVSGAGDTDGDGYDDVIIGAPEHSHDLTSVSAAYLFSGSAAGIDPASETEIFSADGVVIDEFGTSVAGIGDVDGDGVADMMIGAPRNTLDYGAAYVFSTAEHGSPLLCEDGVAISQMGTNADWEAKVPDIAAGSGRFLAVWHGADDPISPTQNDVQVFGQFLDGLGNEIGVDDFWIGDIGLDANLDQRRTFQPSVAYNATDDVFVVAFTGYVEGTETEIWVTTIDGQTGGAVDGPVLISDAASSGALADNPVVAWNETDNEYLVAYRSNATPTDDWEYFTQRLDSSLVQQGPDDQRVTLIGTAGFGQGLSWSAQNNRYLIVWSEYSFIDSDTDIWGLSIAADGTVFGSQFRISDMQGNNRVGVYPKVTYDMVNSMYLVVWHGDTDPITAYRELEVFGQLVSPAGALVGGQIRISQMGVDLDPDSDAEVPHVTWCATGEYLVAWNANDLPTSSTRRVYGQRVSALGNLVGDRATLSSNLYASYTASGIACDDQGTVGTVWTRSDDEAYRQFYATVDTDGDTFPDVVDPCPGLGDLDSDGDGVCDNIDICPFVPTDDTDGDGICDDVDICAGGDDTLDADADGVPDFCDICPLDDPDDTDGDGICEGVDSCYGDNATGDTDSDGVCDSDDSCPADPLNDQDLDGICDGADLCFGDNATGDSDGDGLCDDTDPCPLDNPDDSDGDGSCDTDDLCFGDDVTGDTDGDGVCDGSDICPLDALDDSDGDGSCDSDDFCFGNDASGDLDSDGVCNDTDPCPFNNPDDADGDGSCDNNDLCFGDDATGDTDGDGVCDGSDPCPTDVNDDSDGDGICDGVDLCIGGDATGDTDGDGICDDTDICLGDNASGDTDSDGVCNDTDVCPDDPLNDSDGDGSCDGDDLCFGGDASGDTDGDGVCDDTDLCPLDDPDDTDGDGVCEGVDVCVGDDASGDSDSDGTCDDLDPCPLDSPDDSDGDGVCESNDLCNGDDLTGDSDGDGVCNDLDPCPLDFLDDSDNDGICDGVDLCSGDDGSGDTDTDGVCNDLDPCPLDLNDDSDGDGVCDGVDLCSGDDAAGDPDSDGLCSDIDPCPLDNPGDTDGDGVCDSDDICTGDDATGDDDGDGVCADLDPCPLDLNDDSDGDGSCDGVDLCTGDDTSDDVDGDGVCGDLDPCPLDPLDDSDSDGICDGLDLCFGDDGTGDADGDGVCADLDPCPLDLLDDSDNDGTCDGVDLCIGDDASGDTDGDGTCDDIDPCPNGPLSDSDGDGVCDAEDQCLGDDLVGDSDGDGVCDDLDICTGDDATADLDGDGVCGDLDPCPLDNPDDTDGDGICDSDDICTGDDAAGDLDGDGLCADLDPCPLDNPDDTDGDGVCDSDDVCTGDDATGDTDSDGSCDDLDPCPLDNPDDTDGDGSCDSDDLCTGDDATGDNDADGLCNDVDQCIGDDATGDTDQDGTCDDLDPCPLDDPDDSDSDGVCDSDDVCEGNDATGDVDDDGVCDDLDPCIGTDWSGDTDQDGVCDDLDPCPLDNPDDSDGDSVCDNFDVCPDGDDLRDSDGDGTPDACDTPDDTDDKSEDGCGCATSPGPASLGLWLLLGGLVLRRRA